MLSAILTIAGVIVVIGGIAYFVYTYGAQIAEAWNWACDAVQALGSSLPSWLWAFVGVALLLAVLSILVKLL